MITISLCMIVKNEEATIGRCLDSIINLADEIIIVDTGSTDRTKEVLNNYAAKVYEFTWIDDFAAARNYAFSLATKEYILWLDADDVLLNEDLQKCLDLKKNLDPSVDAVSMNYVLATDESGKAIFSRRRNRLVKCSNNFQWVGPVHEYLDVYGNIFNSDISVVHKSIHHDSNRNLRIYEKRLTQGESFSPRDLYYYANELFDHKSYEKAIEIYQKYLETGLGWVEDNLTACGKLADCFYNLHDNENELKYLFKSFEYDSPRAEFCCHLGFYFLHRNRFKQAVFWYKLATELEKPVESWSLINHACWTWLPHLQLCVCYDKLGNYELACQHNEIAGKFLPDDPKIQGNRDYFRKILKI